MFYGFPYARFPPLLALPSIWNGKNFLPCFFSCCKWYCIGSLLCHPTCYQSALQIFSHPQLSPWSPCNPCDPLAFWINFVSSVLFTQFFGVLCML
jgi:hypothetical protein